MYDKGAQFIKHNGREILYLNLQDLNSTEITEYAKKANEFILKNSEKVQYKLVDLRNAFLSKEMSDIAKESNRTIRDYLKKEAVIGITGIKKIIVTAITVFISSKTKFFNNFDDAINWLTID